MFGEKLDFSRVVLVSLFSLAVGSCGMMEPKYVQYEKKESTATTGTSTDGSGAETSECQATALTAFSASGFSDVLDASCAGACHSSQAPVMKAGEDEKNLASVKASRFFDTTPATFLANVFTDAQTHGGANPNNQPAEDTVSAWLEAEAKCK